MKLEIINLSKSIRGKLVLDGISMTLTGGRAYGLEGKNGSGKTMLMRAVAGLIKPTKGEIIIDGKRLHKDMSFPQSIGVLIENPSFMDDCSGMKNLRFLASIQKRITDEDIAGIMRAVGLDPEDKKKYRKYSLGMKQKLGVAAAVMERPDIVLLDEPINALDTQGVQSVREIISQCKQRGAVVVIACHDKEELELLSDEVFTLYDGRLVSHRTVGDSQ